MTANTRMEAASGVGLVADDADEADAGARAAAEVVRQRLALAAGDRGDLALAGLAAQLRPRFEEHPQPGGADRVAERLQPAVGVHRQLTVEVERAGEHLLPSE